MDTIHLASYDRCLARLRSQWNVFLEKRRDRLQQQERHGQAAERVTENILEDLFTVALDWRLSDVDLQIDYADFLLTRLGIKYLIIEAKRPGALAWSLPAVSAALEQGRRYADEQRVHCVGVSDGKMLYAAEVAHGGLRDRVFVELDGPEPPEMLWWLSVHGIYRPCVGTGDPSPRLLPGEPASAAAQSASTNGVLLHPKYEIPSRCFAYVGDATKPSTWKLPYLRADGSTDTARLPKAIQSILSNYRGAKVTGIPDAAIGDVLVRLALAAHDVGKLPGQAGATAPAYEQLFAALDQLHRLGDVPA